MARETFTEKQLDRRERLVPQGLTNLHPIFVEKAEGGRIVDVEGKSYTDLTSGIGVNNLGHACREVLRAINRQSEAFLHTCFQVGMYESYLDLAELLHELTPGRFGKKTFFTTSGAEAVENAIKFARAYTGRDAVISLQSAFHGRTLYALQLTGRVVPYRSGFGPLSAPIHRIPFPYVYRFPNEDADACRQSCLDALDTLFRCELPGDAFAALVFEPIQGEAGVVVPPEGFLGDLADICRANGILLIADEVQTGVWRTGPFCASAAFGIEPDLVAMAKSLGFGLPIGAVTGRAEILDSLEPGGLGGTMGGNPVACMAALTGLDILRDRQIDVRVANLGRRVLERLFALREECTLVGDVRGRGLMIGIELVQGRRSREPAPEAMQQIVARCRDRGVLVLYGGMHRNMIRLLPPLTIDEDELSDALDTLERTVKEAFVPN